MLAGALLLPAPAAAAQHLMFISEISAGQEADDGYVELTMYAAGQRFVDTHSVTLYDSSGALHDSTTMDHDVANGQVRSTILIGDTGVSPRDFTGEGMNLSELGSGGAACFDIFDCVAWGSFSGGPLPSSAGAPHAGPLPATMAFQRDPSRGSCTNLLDAGDDTNDSSVDLLIGTPSPTPNSAPPSGTCIAPPRPIPPQTKLTSTPPKRASGARARFRFRSPRSGVTFQCRLDKRRWRRCASPQTYRGIRRGRHLFEVRANDGGLKDPTPARYRWRRV